MKARTQLTVAATAVAAVLVALTGQFLIWRVDQRDRDDLDAALAGRAAQIATDATRTGKLPTDGIYAVRLMSGTQVRAQSGSTAKFSAPVTDGFSTVTTEDGQQYRSWAETLKTGVQMQVLTGLSGIRSRHSAAVRLVDLAVLVALVVGGLINWLVTGIVLRPLRRMREGARALRPDDLSGRLPSVSEPSELAEVAASVNALLDRMEATAAAGAPPAPATGPVFAPPAVSTVTPPPAEPPVFPPRAPEKQPEPARPRDDEGLRNALAKLGDDLDTLLDNPELTSTQRHLVLASIQNEYRRIVVLTRAGDVV